MPRSPSQVPPGLTLIYLILTLLAPIPAAWRIAEVCVRAAGVTESEGASAFRTLFQTPLWWGLLMVVLLWLYWVLRRHIAVLWFIALALTIPALVLARDVFDFFL